MRSLALILALVTLAPTAVATFPYPAAPAGQDPSAFADYLRLAAGQPLPNDYTGGSVWKYSSLPSGDPTIDSSPSELHGITGMSVDQAWRISTGRPDVVIAVLDSGIKWDERDVRAKVHLNVGEIPNATDRNGDGVINAVDFEGLVNDSNGNGFVDGQDIIRAFSDGVDDDHNGYVDDIAGWNALDDNNDPSDDVRYGHGTGEATDSNGEADNGDTIPGTCPSCEVLPIRVGMSFIATDTDFGEGVRFALASHVSVIQEALGTVDDNSVGRDAVEAAWDANVPIVASAADEASYHHNFPAAHEHTITVNSVTKFDAFVAAPQSYLVLNGCTNFGANIAVTVSSASCSSEATGRGAGIAGLIVSAAKNAGLALSANEVRQLMTTTADDIDFTGQRAVAAPVPTLRYPSGPGFDTYFGYGRLNARAAVAAAAAGRIPPEAEITSPTWWQPLPAHGTLVIRGLAAAPRAIAFGYTLEVGCGLAPPTWTTIAHGEELGAPVHELGALDLGLVNAVCALERVPTTEAPLEPNVNGITVRLRVTDSNGLVGEHRKYFFSFDGPEAVLDMHASGEQSPRFADIDGDGRPELVVSTSDGIVHAFRADMTEIHGWPVHTSDHDSILHGGVAIADLDGDGRVEVVASTYQGHTYVWNADGSLRWKRDSDPRFTSARDPFNRVYKGFVAAPVLADLDGDGHKEVIQAGMDRHLYVWDARGHTRAGFPALVIDRTRMRVTDPATDHLAPIDPSVVGQGAEIVSTPAVADLDGDGRLEMVVGHNEEYFETPDASPLTSATAATVGASGLLSTGNGRLHAIRADGTEMPGWPVKVPDLAMELLPTVGDGVPGSASIADINGDGKPEIAIFSTAGPVMLFNADGTPFYGRDPVTGLALTMRTEVPALDAPVLPAAGLGALADITGRGTWRYFAPAAGVQRALDAALPEEQIDARDLLMAWDARTGAPAPGWPKEMEDLMFITSPAIADIDGDGAPEVLMGSGGYSLHAFDAATGAEKLGWPKFTGGWIIATPAIGDWNGDGRNDIAVTTREGYLFVWDAGGHVGGRAPWPTIHHDNANTGNEGPEQGQGQGHDAAIWAAPLIGLAAVWRRRARR